MQDYSKLVEALRCKFIAYDVTGNHNSAQLYKDAADAIEELQAEVEKQRDTLMMFGGETGIRQMREELGHWQELAAKLQAEVERLKDSNEELRDKQTYIDHYGTEWMTSAKDVPTAAYKHGYADGRDEAMAKMEVQDGENES